MKLLLDQGLPRSTARLLREEGHDAVHVADIGMAAAADTRIIEYARQQGMVVVTLDADFHAALATTAAASPSAIRFRVEGVDASWLAQRVHQATVVLAAELRTGALVTIEHHRMRIRNLFIS